MSDDADIPCAGGRPMADVTLRLAVWCATHPDDNIDAEMAAAKWGGTAHNARAAMKTLARRGWVALSREAAPKADDGHRGPPRLVATIGPEAIRTVGEWGLRR